MSNRNISKPGDPPTEIQQNVFEFLKSHLIEHGWMPTVREISDHFGWGGGNASVNHLTALEKKGLIEIGKKKMRCIRLVGYEIKLVKKKLNQRRK